MARAIVLMLDSLGIGAAPDAGLFGDEGADTFGHIAEACAAGTAPGRTRGPLFIPHFCRLGLAHAAAGRLVRHQPGLLRGVAARIAAP